MYVCVCAAIGGGLGSKGKWRGRMRQVTGEARSSEELDGLRFDSFCGGKRGGGRRGSQMAEVWRSEIGRREVEKQAVEVVAVVVVL